MEDTLTEAMRDRAATYGLLARLLGCEVDVDLLGKLCASEFPSDTGDEDVDEGSGLMSGYLAAHAHDLEATRTELAVDFARLFVVRARKQTDAAYPFESVYTSEKHTTMGAARDAVRSLYRKAGLELDDSWHIGEDHIALELEFMAFLAQKSLEACEAGRDDELAGLLGQQRSFLSEHLLNWVGRFADAMARQAKTDFYRGVARYLMGYLNSDGEFLGEMASR